MKNRPGFEKQFRALSDTAWNHAINLIKHIAKRGGAHDFYTRRSAPVDSQKKRILELDELNALALALDTEKSLAAEAHSLHERYSHANHKAHYDAEVSILLYVEFRFRFILEMRSLEAIVMALMNKTMFLFHAGCPLFGREIH